MQFLGFGFNMAAQDVGLEQSFDRIEKSLKQINGMIEDQNKLAGKSAKSGLWARMKEGVRDFNMAAIAGNIRKLAGETGNLTSGLESMAAANEQASAPIVAQMDLSGDAARKLNARISGMAIGMRVGAGEIAGVFKTLSQAGPPAKAVIDELNLSEKDWVKITTTSGISMAEFTGVMGDLAGEWNVAPKRAAGMLNSLVEIGKKTGTGIQALKSATATVDEFGQIQITLAKHLRLSGDEIVTATEQAFKLSGAYRDMGANEEQAVQLGRATAKMFMEQSAAYKRARAMGEPLPDDNLFVQLRAAGIESGEAMRIMETGEKDAVAGMQLLQEAWRKQYGSSEMANVMLGKLGQTLGQSGQSLVWLAESGGIGAASLEKVSKMALDGKSNLKTFGDQAFRSGMTLQESFDLAKQGFEQSIRGIARANVRQLVQKQMAGYKRMGKAVKELGSDETWGPLMHAWSTFEQMGVRGVGLAFLDKNASAKTRDNAIDMGIAFETGFDALQKVGGELQPLMEILQMFGPLGPLAAMGGIAALFAMDEADAKGILGGFYDTFKGLKDMVMKVWDMIPWETLWEKFNKVTQKIWDSIVNDIPWRDMLDKVMPVVVKVGSALFDALWDAIKTFMSHLSGGTLALSGALAGAFIGTQLFGPFGALIGLGVGAAVAMISGIDAEYEAAAAKWDEKLKKREAEVAAREAEGSPIVQQETMKQTLTVGAQLLFEQEGGAANITKQQQKYYKRQSKKLGEGKTWIDAYAKELEERAALFLEWDDDFKRKVLGEQFASNEAIRKEAGSGIGAGMSWEVDTGKQKATIKKNWEDMMKSTWMAGAFVDQETEEMRAAYDRRQLEWQNDMPWYAVPGSYISKATGAEWLVKQQEDEIQKAKEVRYAHEAIADVFRGNLRPEQEALIENMKKIAHLGPVSDVMTQSWETWAAEGPESLRSHMQELIDKYLPEAERQAFDQWQNAIYDPSHEAYVLTEQEITAAYDRWGDLFEQFDVQRSEQLGRVGMMATAPEDIARLDNITAAVDRYKASIEDLTSADEEWIAANKDWMFAADDETSQMAPEAPGEAPQAGPGAALVGAVQAFESEATNAAGRVVATISDIGNQMTLKTGEVATSAAEGGASVATQWGAGFSGVSLVDVVDPQMQSVAAYLGGSLPEDGPLGGVPGNNPAYFGGQSVMQQFADGFVSAEEYAAQQMSEAIRRLVESIFMSYESAMTAEFNRSTAISQMADEVIAQFGAKVEMGRIDTAGGAGDLGLKSGKELFKVALDKPGLVSVVTAIIASGQETQKILVAIKKDTESIAKAPIMSQTARVGTQAVTPG